MYLAAMHNVDCAATGRSKEQLSFLAWYGGDLAEVWVTEQYEFVVSINLVSHAVAAATVTAKPNLRF